MSKIRQASIVGFVFSACLLVAAVFAGSHAQTFGAAASLSFLLSCLLGVCSPEHQNTRTSRHDHSFDPLSSSATYSRHDEVDFLHLGSASSCVDPFCVHCSQESAANAHDRIM